MCCMQIKTPKSWRKTKKKQQHLKLELLGKELCKAQIQSRVKTWEGKNFSGILKEAKPRKYGFLPHTSLQQCLCLKKVHMTK